MDYKLKAVISAFCIVGNCPTPPAVTKKVQSKEVGMFLIDHDMHQSLFEIVNTESTDLVTNFNTVNSAFCSCFIHSLLCYLGFGIFWYIAGKRLSQK